MAESIRLRDAFIAGRIDGRARRDREHARLPGAEERTHEPFWGAPARARAIREPDRHVERDDLQRVRHIQHFVDIFHEPRARLAMIRRDSDRYPSPPAPVDPGYALIPGHPHSRLVASASQGENGIS